MIARLLPMARLFLKLIPLTLAAWKQTHRLPGAKKPLEFDGFFRWVAVVRG